MGTRERNFARGLTGVGTASQVRENATLAVRESSLQSKARSVTPVDYETYLVKHKAAIMNDPLRELIMLPSEDVTVTTCPRTYRTVVSSVPPNAEEEATDLLARQAIKNYTCQWPTVTSCGEAYAGSYLELPVQQNVASPLQLKEHKFEIDQEKDEEGTHYKQNEVTKKGFLLKGPDSANESINFLSKSMKRRYVCLKREQDGTYFLDIFKDDKKVDGKATFLDSAVGVVQNQKKGKHAFEIRMPDNKAHLFAGETEGEMREWMAAIKQAISADTISQRSLNSRHEDDTISMNGSRDGPSSLSGGTYQEIQSYSHQTDSQLAKQRKQDRFAMFKVYADLPRSTRDPMNNSEPFSEKLGNRLLLSVNELKTKLQANVADEGKQDKFNNPEPFFLTFTLYDAKLGQRISESVSLDVNDPDVLNMIPKEMKACPPTSSAGEPPMLGGMDEAWLRNPSKVLFSVSKPHSEVYLVVLMEKVLQGGVAASSEPYLKGVEMKMGTKMHDKMRQYCSTIGRYRQPFAWGAKAICNSKGHFTYQGDMTMYRTDANRVSEEDLIKRLTELHRPEKVAKWQQVPMTFSLRLEPHPKIMKGLGVVTSSNVPVEPPFAMTPAVTPVREVEEFIDSNGADLSHPFAIYKNNLYVYPKSLKFDNVKNVKARNIACSVELRDSDADGALPLRCVYGKPGMHAYTSAACCAVLHHTSNPDFYEEVKLALPTNLSESHHILFTFYHVSCEGSVRPQRSSTVPGSASAGGKGRPEIAVGYAWLPLIKSRKIEDGERVLAVASNLPPNYLSHETKTSSGGPDVKWQDGQKLLFRAFIRPASTIYTTESYMNNFFLQTQKWLGGEESFRLLQEARLQSLMGVDISVILSFLPTLINQLLMVLTKSNNTEISLNAIKVLTHVVNEVSKLKEKAPLLKSYVKYAFDTTVLSEALNSAPNFGYNSTLRMNGGGKGSGVGSTSTPHPHVSGRTVHEDLIRQLTLLLHPQNSDFIIIQKFLNHSWFFLEIVSKSMMQYLVYTGRIKMSRLERFPHTQISNFTDSITNFMGSLTTRVFGKFRENPAETRNANRSVAYFIRRCFSVLDRGFVFQLISTYMANFSPGDPQPLHEYKFEFLSIICGHQHYVQLNLPMLGSGYKGKEVRQEYSLSDEFRSTHYLSGLLLQELESALKEVPATRLSAIKVLRDQLAKHAFDDRYATAKKQGRIAALYLPFFNLLLENHHRITVHDEVGLGGISPTESGPSNGGDNSHHFGSNRALSEIPPGVSSVSLGRASGASGMSLAKRFSNDSNSTTTPPPSGGNREGGVLAMIAGVSANPLKNSKGETCGSATSLGSCGSTSTVNAGDDASLYEHTRSPSDGRSAVARGLHNSPFSKAEVSDLLVCFLYLLDSLADDILVQWMNNTSEIVLLRFFHLLDICLRKFQYQGRKQLGMLRIEDALAKESALRDSYSKKSSTMPAKRAEMMAKNVRILSSYGDTIESLRGLSEVDSTQSQIMLDGNKVNEVGMSVLDVLHLYCLNFKSQLEHNIGDNPTMTAVFNLHLRVLSMQTSEEVLRASFGVIRMFIQKFPKVLFMGAEGKLCKLLCYDVLRCCDSRLPSIQKEACITMYVLMKANFDFTKKKNFTRVHLQTIVSVSRLISNHLAGERFKSSLTIINNFAYSDKYSSTAKGFSQDVKALVKRIRGVLNATRQMQEHKDNHEMYVDLQYNLANSYMSSPELRKTWLENMADKHLEEKAYCEAAHCYLHVASVIAEFLRRKKVCPLGCALFKEVSRNIELDEKVLGTDSVIDEEIEYSEELLVEVVERCVDLFCQAKRFEQSGKLYQAIIPIYEKKRQFEKLTHCYNNLHTAYSSVVAVTDGRRQRLLGAYFRVAFFGQGQLYFDEEEDQEYIYKEEGGTRLPTIIDRLHKLYGNKYGHDKVKFIQDSKLVEASDLDPQYAFIQITAVDPYFNDKELSQRVTDFEQADDIKRFFFDTPFTKNGERQGAVANQHCRRTVLQTKRSFPYVTKRILVDRQLRKEEVLGPIDMAIESMRKKTRELESVIKSKRVDLNLLHLRLQGAVRPQVNSGPMEYAAAFFTKAQEQQNSAKVAYFKQVFDDFMVICERCLHVNHAHILEDQRPFHDQMVEGLLHMKETLAALLTTNKKSVYRTDSWGSQSSVSSRMSNQSQNVYGVSPAATDV